MGGVILYSGYLVRYTYIYVLSYLFLYRKITTIFVSYGLIFKGATSNLRITSPNAD